MEMRHHKLEIMLKDRKIGKSDRKIGSDFEKKKIGSENRIGHFFKIVPSLITHRSGDFNVGVRLQWYDPPQ